MTNAIQPVTPFDELRTLALQSVAESSARVYADTFDKWGDYAHNAGHSPLDLRPVNVLAFIDAQNTSKATRQRQLSALRKLAQMGYILTGTDEARRLYEALQVVKAPTGKGGQERSRKALTPSEADKLFRVWTDDTPLHRRNHALIALLALGGIRRSEAAMLRWRDVDFTNGVITIAHGKGDKRREVPLAGDLALDALRQWQITQDAGRAWVFCSIRKNGILGVDKPITGTDVYRTVEATVAASGIDFKPHDLRRTFITEALATGTPLATVQAIAGHAQGSTTLTYAQAVNAREARKALKLRYG